MYGKYVQEIREASENNKLVFFVGAGVSMLSGYPGWYDLILSYHTSLYPESDKEKFSQQEFLSIPEKFMRVRGKEKLDAALKATFNVELDHNAVHDKMMALNPAYFLTTNYDTLLEQVCTKRGQYYSVISSDKDVAAADSNKLIIKAHGDFSQGFDSDNIVLMHSQYNGYERNFPLVSVLLKSILSMNTVVFVGYSLNDKNIEHLMDWVRYTQQEGYTKPLWIRTKKEPLDEHECTFYDGIGIRIIEACNIQKINDDSYDDMYNRVMNLLVDSNNEEIPSLDPESIINYVHDRVTPLLQLNEVRKVDMKKAFNDKYFFNRDGIISSNTRSGTNYLAMLFDLKADELKLSEEIDQKYSEVMTFFSNTGVVGVLGDKRLPGKYRNLIISNPAFHADFDEMRAIIDSSGSSIDEMYNYAYYYASLGDFKKSYSMYEKIITVARETNDWLVYYLAQINRFSVYQSMLSIGGAPGTGFGPEFLQNVKEEMKGFKIESVFENMPYTFKNQYRSLESLSKNFDMREDMLAQYEGRRKSEKNISKRSVTFGLTPADKVSLDLYENLRFLYQNMIFTTHFSSANEYIKASYKMMMEYEHYQSNRNKFHSETHSLFAPESSSFSIDAHDFVLICKSFKYEDLRILDNSLDLSKFKYTNDHEVQGYLLRLVDEASSRLNDEKGLYGEFVHLYINEAVSAVYQASNVKLNNGAVKKLIHFALFDLSERFIQNNQKVSLVHRLLDTNSLTDEIVEVLENFILKHCGDYTSSDTSWSLCNRISYLRKGYVSEKLSDYVLALDEDRVKELEFMFKLSAILSDKAKEHILKLKPISSINDIVYGDISGILTSLDDYKDTIYKYIQKRYQNKQDEEKLRKFSLYADNYPVDFARAHFLGVYDDERIKDFIGFSDEFDFYVAPENFDFDKFNPVWLIDLFENSLTSIAKNSYMKAPVIKAVMEHLKETKDHKMIGVLDILLKEV